MAPFNMSFFERDREDDYELEALQNVERNRNRSANQNGNVQNNRQEVCHPENVRDIACDNNEVLAANRRNEANRRLREECLIAFKVYDSCRQQDCLAEPEIGFARAAEDICIEGEHTREGDVINPPNNAAAVTVDRLRIKKIIIVEKRPNPIRNGFWNIDLKYVFEYRITFREANGQVIASVRANSIYNKAVTLFGSVGADLAIATDILSLDGNTIQGEPFVLVEAKAVALTARLQMQRRGNAGCEDLSPAPTAVVVTIGLFTIIKLFRIVNLSVQSRGFCIPPECEEISPLNPCESFNDMDFPLDAFAPPQRPEFLAGISNNIPNSNNGSGCGCGCAN